MAVIDSAIKDVGLVATIMRTGGNISTYAYISPKASRTPYERDAMFPTDSGVTDGDLVQVSGSYYLVINLIRDERAGEFFLFKAKLYKCSHSVTVKAFAAGVFTDVKVNVPCLITDGSAMTASDRGIVVPGFGGKNNVYYLYIQAGSGIDKNSVLKDSDNRSLRVSGNINPFFSKGISEVPIVIEGV